MDIITFQVEPHNIKAGKQGNCKTCPVALQLKQRYPDAEIEVHGDDVTMDGEKWVDNDGSLSEFVTVFDRDIDAIFDLNEDELAEHNALMDNWEVNGYPIELRRAE